MQSNFFLKKHLIALMLLFTACVADAQVSLLPEHMITVEGVTLIRDSKNADKWYYVPEKPFLLEKTPGKKDDPRPVFQLVTYQAKNDTATYDGGVLQFCVTLNMPEETRKKVEKALKERSNNKNAVSLTILPFHKAEAFLFDGSGKITADGSQAPGFSPAYITGALPFQLKMDRFDADLYSTLVDKKGSGVGVLMNLTFEGLLPPGGFKATINWDQTYESMKSSSDLRISLGTYFCGIDVGVSKTKIREKLVSEGCLTVESLTSESVDAATLDRYLEPVLQRLQNNLIEKISPPEVIDTDNAAKPDALSKCFFGLRTGIDVKLRELKLIKKGSETFIFNQSVVAERRTSCGAFIGINSYPESVKSKLVSTFFSGAWASAYLLLPVIDTNPELGIKSVVMTAEVVDSDGRQISELSDIARWSSADPFSWKNKDGAETGSLKFPLLSLFKKHNDDLEVIRKEYAFKIDVSIEQNHPSSIRANIIKVRYQTPLFDGNLPLPTAVDIVDNIIIDLSALSFNNDDGIKKLKIVLKKGSKGTRIENVLLAKDKIADRLVYLIEATREGEKAESIIPVLTADIGSKRNLPWVNNDKDLRVIEPSLHFMLFDSDWQQ
ncbi:MAG TPA: hypothetical protein PLK28_02770 [Candidatus Rifleibacterium sp.]|nr:hypothetical protein [Candidatus Rifleibacterium sp.]